MVLVFAHCSIVCLSQLPDLRRRFEKLCRDASMRRPSVLIFEDLDALFPVASEHDPSSGLITAQRTELFCDTFTALALRLNTSSSLGGVCLIATVRSSATVGAPLRAPPLFSESYEIRPPNAVCRADILLRQLRVRGFAHSFDVDELAAGSEGYSGRDLSLLLDRIFLAAQARTQSECRRLQHEGRLLATAELCLSAADVSAAQLGFVPAALRDIPLQKSTVSWSDIGGLHSVHSRSFLDSLYDT
jgi:peroxin-1